VWLDTRDEHVAIPAGTAVDGLRLTGLRRCFSVRGGVAHVMYDQGGAPVSLFILRGTSSGSAAATRELEAVGHKAILWTAGANTYMLIGRRHDLGETARHLQEEISERADQR
jgi:anti-sigma factor RsiW